MNHQITLVELGIIPRQIDSDVDRSKYASPCGGCICEHCSNNVDCIDKCTGEADFGCFNCDECLHYSRKGTDRWKHQCLNLKVTNEHTKAIRRAFKLIIGSALLSKTVDH